MISKILKIVILSVLLAFVPSSLFAQCYDTPADRMQSAPHMLNSVTEELEWVTGAKISGNDLSINLESKIREQERARARQRAGTTIEEVNSTRNRRVANDNSKIGLRMSSGNSEMWRERQRMIREERERRQKEIDRKQRQEALQYAAKLNAMEAELTARLQNQIANNTNLQRIENLKDLAAAFENNMKTGNVIKEKPADDKNDLTQGMQPVSDRPLPVLLEIMDEPNGISDLSDTELVTVNAYYNSIIIIPDEKI